VTRIRGSRTRHWWITIAAVGGLLAAIILVGLVGLLVNRNVKGVVEQALEYDVELEDEADDLRVAILDMRHYHRNLFFVGPVEGNRENFEEKYDSLREEIGELERIGVRTPGAPQPDEIRDTAERYYAGFRPAIELYESDPEAFEQASDRGLEMLEELEDVGEKLDKLGEERASAALGKVNRATSHAQLILFAVIGGLFLVGAALAYSAVRVVGELRRSYAEKQETAEKLAAASRAKTDFLADVSHELRTPLAILRGTGELGLEVKSDGVHAEFLEDMVAESEKMSRMVEDLLFLARSDSTVPPIKPEPVAVAPFLVEVAGRAEALARQRGVALRAALTGEGELRVDPARIEQAVLILVDNAAKYSPPGGCVNLTSETKSGEMRIEVVDRGPGVPEAELPYVFDRFYRVDKMRGRKQGGAGLGLSIAKTIAEAHGGRIEAASRVGQGTRMSLCLPLADAPQPAGKSRKQLALGDTP
jgi:two-component system sensor histidine kinase VicK